MYNRTNYILTSCSCPVITVDTEVILNNIVLYNSNINADVIYNTYNTIIVDAVVISKITSTLNIPASAIIDALRELRHANIISKIKSDVYQLNAIYKSLYNTSDTQAIIAGAKPND